MTWLKENWFRVLLILIILIGALCFWYLYININIGINKEYLLRKSIKQYSDLIDVGLHEQAFDKFLTPAAKQKVETRDVITHDYEQERKCREAVSGSALDSLFACSDKFTTHTSVDVAAMEIFKKYAERRKNNWRNYRVNKTVFSDNNRADVQFDYTENDRIYNAPETWYYQSGKWLRDF